MTRKMKPIDGMCVANITEWATSLGLFEWYYTDIECDDGYRVAVVYGPYGDVEVGEVDMAEIARLPRLSTLDSVRGSRMIETSLLWPAGMLTRWKPARD